MHSDIKNDYRLQQTLPGMRSAEFCIAKTKLLGKLATAMLKRLLREAIEGWVTTLVLVRRFFNL